jgi:hypothetical protein
MMNTHTIPTTQNEDWGFYGSMGENANAAWELALTEISAATDQPLDTVRIFLDSRHGRHFADDVQNHLLITTELQHAVHAAAKQWLSWKITKSISKDYGIPRGLNYLTGLVIQCEMDEELT